MISFTLQLMLFPAPLARILDRRLSGAAPCPERASRHHHGRTKHPTPGNCDLQHVAIEFGAYVGHVSVVTKRYASLKVPCSIVVVVIVGDNHEHPTTSGTDRDSVRMETRQPDANSPASSVAGIRTRRVLLDPYLEGLPRWMMG